MQDDVKNNELEQQDGAESASETSSRRKFIKKAAVGGIITTLPATSVWGVCRVSGALSGGSLQADKCNLPILSGGRSPRYWKQKQQFPRGFSEYSEDDKGCLRDAIIGFQEATTIELDTGVSINLYDGLYSNGSGSNLAFHLAAAYLNAHYGFYSMPISINGTEDSINTAEELVQHLYAATFKSGVYTIILAIKLSYEEGESHFSDFSC